MILNTQTFTQLVQNQAAAIQTKTRSLVDFTVGSILRAVVEATSAVALWLQAVALQVMALTRAATSKGADLDSWMADFNFFRLGANAANGLVTFSRFTPTLQAVVPLRAGVQTGDGSQKFVVALDTTNPAWSAPLNGYVIPPGQTSLAVLVQAVTPSTASNVLANTITVLTTNIPGVDFISNAGAFSGGSDPESDPAFLARFVVYIAGLRAGTESAVANAVLGLGVGAAYNIVETQNLDGSFHPGFFYVVVDDGSGNPPSSLLTAAYKAIDAIRAVTVSFAVFPPQIVLANVSMTIGTAPGFDHPTVVGQVGQAVTTYLNTQTVGAGMLSYFKLAQIAMDIQGVTDLTGYSLNLGQSDIILTPQQVIKAGTVSVA